MCNLSWTPHSNLETNNSLNHMPAIGRPCVSAFLIAGTVPAFTCVLSALLRGDARATCVCLRLQEQSLHSIVHQLLGVAHVLLLRLIASFRGSEYTCIQALRVDRKCSDCSKAPRNS